MPKKQSGLSFVLHASLAAFGTYFCMYAFRKPFSVATFEGMVFFGINYKILLVIAQVLGYALSKFVGIQWFREFGLIFTDGIFGTLGVAHELVLVINALFVLFIFWYHTYFLDKHKIYFKV